MKITIITPTYNSASTLGDTIDSIVQQNYPDLEYIIVDGGSTDSTRDMVTQYQDTLVIKFISEPDNGIYDAMNKGVRMATGDVIGILNSDDFYPDSETLKKVAEAFAHDTNLDATYSDLSYVSQNDTSKVTRYWKAENYEESKLDYGWIIPHPTFFLKRRVYTELDRIFDTRLTLAADYELILRLLKIKKIKVSYIPEALVAMREGGASARGIMHRIRGWNELRMAWEINSLKRPRFFIIKRITRKIGQFFKKSK